MNLLARALELAIEGLVSSSAPHALVGGLAVSARSEPRFTRAVDLAVAVPGDDRAEHIAHHLFTHGWRVVAQVEQDSAHRLSTLRLVTGEAEGVVVDLLFASSGIEPEIVAAATPLEVFGGVVVPVATVPHLVAIKVLSLDEATRPQDRLDVLTLLPLLGPEGQEQVLAALDQITERGFHRGRELRAEFDRLCGG